jgi:oleate hydratase
MFFELIRDVTGNVPGEGGLITFLESSWLASIVLPHQPHFIAQPEGVQVFWGYGLFVDIPGNFVKKPMSACTGREIMTEMSAICASRIMAPGFSMPAPAFLA